LPIYHDLPAPPLSADERERIAEEWLYASRQTNRGPVDIETIIRCAHCEIVELSKSKMGDNEAFARAQVNTIFVSASFKQGVFAKQPEHLFKLAHEFSHLVLHRGPLAKPLKVSGNSPLSWKPAAERQEDQAWDLARSIMLPRMHLRGDEMVDAIMQEFNAPREHAVVRLNQLRVERRKLRKPCEDLPSKAREIWEAARIHPDFDKDFTRLSKSGLRVAASSYNRLDRPFGWYVCCGAIYSKDETEFW